MGTDTAWQSEAAPTGNGDGCTTYDHTAPTITSLNVPARTSSGFAVTWSAQDNLTGISHYDVQYKNESGVWTGWLASTHATQSVFTGPGGHAYTFRVRATDGAGNTSGWQTSGLVTVLQVKKYYTPSTSLRAGFGGRRVAMRAEGVVYFLHTDHLGSTSLVTTGAGAEVARQLYLPYGAPRWISGTLPTDFTFTGQQNVSQINLLFYRARSYSSSLGRFVSADTIVLSAGNPQSLNKYAYTLGNPLKFIDPTGHAACQGYADCDGGGATPPPPPPPPSCAIHQAFCLGWNWLTGQGADSTQNNPVIFGPNEQMTQDLMRDEGVNRARAEFTANGGVQSDRSVPPDGMPDKYPYKADLESYYRGFIFKATWTSTYLGSYSVEIAENGDGTATFVIDNESGLKSVSHIPSSNYRNPTVEKIILGNIQFDKVDTSNPLSVPGQILRQAFPLAPHQQPGSLADVWSWYVPSGFFENKNSEIGPGRTIYQRYTWTETIPQVPSAP